MNPGERKKQWKKFNETVNNLARCIVCNKLFEATIVTCSRAHNICRECYSPIMKGTTCGYQGCGGVFLEETGRNLLLERLSELRCALYRERGRINEWDDNPWMEMLQCEVCFEPFTNGVFMCHNGHSWCQACQDGLVKITQFFKCPFCNTNFEFRYRRNQLIEEIVSKLKRQVAVEPIRRKGMFTCPIQRCGFSYPLHCMYRHLCDQHPLQYYRKEKLDFAEGMFYRLDEIEALDFSAAITVKCIGLYGIRIDFGSTAKGRCIINAYMFCLSAFREKSAYQIKLKYRTNKNSTAMYMKEGEVNVADTLEIVKDREDKSSSLLRNNQKGVPIKSKIEIFFSIH